MYDVGVDGGDDDDEGWTAEECRGLVRSPCVIQGGRGLWRVGLERGLNEIVMAADTLNETLGYGTMILILWLYVHTRHHSSSRRSDEDEVVQINWQPFHKDSILPPRKIQIHVSLLSSLWIRFSINLRFRILTQSPDMA